jgi:hypothetical protein
MIKTHHRPDLKPAILALIAKVVPAVRDGGQVPLAALVAAVVGNRLTAEARAKLDARGDMIFKHKDGVAHFTNEGPETKIELARFNVKIARKVSGDARLVGDGASLRFNRGLYAQKLFFSVHLETIEMTSERVFVDLEGSSFDQLILLSA